MRKARFALAAALALLAAGCVIPQYEEAREMLDEKTGTTVIAMGAPLEFYSPQPELGLQAASFAHLGALEVNRMGARRLLLWLSVLPGGNPGAQAAPAAAEPARVAILADAHEVVPAFASARAEELGLSRTPFKRAADWAHDGYYDVTLEQLREFQSSGSLALQIAAGDGRMQRYDLWSPDRTGLARFIERIAAEQRPSRQP